MYCRVSASRGQCNTTFKNLTWYTSFSVYVYTAILITAYYLYGVSDVPQWMSIHMQYVCVYVLYMDIKRCPFYKITYNHLIKYAQSWVISLYIQKVLLWWYFPGLLTWCHIQVVRLQQFSISETVQICFPDIFRHDCGEQLQGNSKINWQR